MSRREFNQCLAYLQINPPEAPANQRTASLMAIIHNTAGKTSKKDLSADDFLGKSKETEPQTMEEQKAMLMAFEGK